MGTPRGSNIAPVKLLDSCKKAQFNSRFSIVSKWYNLLRVSCFVIFHY